MGKGLKFKVQKKTIMEKVAQQVRKELNNNSNKLKLLFKCGLIMIISALSLLLNAQVSQTIYIDPTYSGTQKGTISQPYTSLPIFQSNSAYLIKGGTTLTTNTDYAYNVNNCILGSYNGVANIECNVVGRCFFLIGNNNSIQDLNIKSLNNNGNAPNQSTVVELKVSGGKSYLKNLNISGGWRGIVGGNYDVGTGVVSISNCTVNSTQHDGIYVSFLDSLIVDNVKVWNVNLNYAVDYGGDALQSESVKYVKIDHSSFDHTSTSGKYALIVNGYINATVSNTILKSKNGEACTYPGDNVDDNIPTYYTMTNCILDGGMRGIQNRCDNFTATNCIISNSLTYAIESGDQVTLNNCVFANVDTAILIWWPTTKTIKNCIFYNVYQPFAGVGMTGNNNLFYNASVKYNTKWNTFLGTNVIEKDPILTSPSTLDYTIKKGSPCIDAGDNNISVKYDLLNVKRPQGTAVDIGAYEYISGVADTTPVKYVVTGGGTICSAGTGIAVGLGSSDVGISYQLFKGTSASGSPIAGTGSAISFGNQTSEGTYTVVATDTKNKSTNTMTGSAVITLSTAPKTFSITGGGSICSGGSGIAIGLNGSESGVNYQLYRGTTIVGATIAGTGAVLNFGSQTTAGTYSVIATKASSTCVSTMTGTSTISVISLPKVYTVSGGGTYSGIALTIKLSGSESGVVYQLYRGTTTVGSSVAGTGSAISFTSLTLAGTYTVVASKPSTTCTVNMSGSAIIIVSATKPTVYNVNGGGAYCADATGVSVSLSGSESGVNYQLYLGSVKVGSAVSGSGSGLGFGLQKSTGTYTVIATNQSTGTTSTMQGSAIVTVNALPSVYIVTGGGSIEINGADVLVGLSKSEIGVNYQLYRGNTATGGYIAGSGSEIDFGNQTVAGTYTVIAQRQSSGCSVNMSGSATIVDNTKPKAFNITGGGQFCDGELGVNIGLSLSESGVSYQLYNGDVIEGLPINGNNNALDFGKHIKAGTYKIIGTNNLTKSYTTMTGSAIIFVNSLPIPYEVIGGGVVNSTIEGVSIGLSNSELNVQYQLYFGNEVVGSTIVGNGKSLDFGKFSKVGKYTVSAQNSKTTCSDNMSGVVTIITDETTAIYDVTGGGIYVAGGTGVPVGLSGSVIGVDYQLYKDGIAIGSPITGTGSVIEFGSMTEQGVYTVLAIDRGTSAATKMSGKAEVKLNTATSVNSETSSSQQFIVYPNPSNGNFNVKLENPSNGAQIISIYNLIGVKVYEKVIESGSDIVNIQQNLSVGNYLLRVMSDKNIMGTKKIVIQ